MVALLEKIDRSEGFHQIVDFLNASHIRFAFSENPTIYDSHIKQFWQTDTVNILDNGEQEITATVDGHVKTVTIASVRKYLQLVDTGGLSSLPNTKFFDQLSLMGETIGQEVEILQSNFPTQTPVADKATFIGVDVIHGGAATTISSIDEGQGSGNNTKSPTMPYDSPLLAGHTPGSDEGIMQLQELMALCIKLSDKVLALETDLRQTNKVYGTAYTKLILKVKKLEKTIKSNQARRRAKIVVSDDKEDLEDSSKQGRMIEEIDQDAGVTLVTPTHSQEDQPKDQLRIFSAAKVLADAAKNVHIYTRRRRAISTSSDGVSTASRLFSTTEKSVFTAGASMPVSTTGMIQEFNKDKDKGIMTEYKLDQTKTKLQQRQERAGYEAVSEGNKTVSELTTGSSKRDAEVELDHEGSKKQKNNEALRLVQEQPEEEETEFPQEDLQQMMMVVPVEEADNLVKLWDLVKKRFITTEPIDDKEKELWVELKRLFKPDIDDTL
ncbi:hypothetical protein Tco_0001104 [Tanacetum coccineum]